MIKRSVLRFKLFCIMVAHNFQLELENLSGITYFLPSINKFEQTIVNPNARMNLLINLYNFKFP